MDVSVEYDHLHVLRVGSNDLVRIIFCRDRPEARPAKHGAILLRAAQITLSDFQPPDLSGKPVLLLSGADDPTILPERLTRLVASLHRYGASLETEVVAVGHELSAADIRFGRQWIESNCFAC